MLPIILSPAATVGCLPKHWVLYSAS